MPTRNITSRATLYAPKTRPRISRGVFRWRRTRRAIDVGALKKPEIVTRTMATTIDVAKPYRTPAMPIAIVEKTIHVPSGSRAEYFAITRLPATKPTEVRPSWRPYSNSVAWRASIANGRRRTFQRPNERKIGAPETNSDRRIGVLARVVTPSLRFATTTRTLVASSVSILPTRTKTRQAAEKRNVRASR